MPYNFCKLLLLVAAVFSLNGKLIADSIRIDPDRITGGKGVEVNLRLDQPADREIVLTIHLSGPNPATAPNDIRMSTGQKETKFKLITVPAATEQHVDIAINKDGTTIARARLIVTPPALTSLTLNKNVVVGGAPNSAITGTVTLNEIAPSAGITVQLSHQCSGCTHPVSMDLPSTVSVNGGLRTATFEFHPGAIVSQKQFTILAGFNGVVKTAAFTNDSLRPQSITVSPSTISNSQIATATITFNAPAYQGYKFQLFCTHTLKIQGIASAKGCHSDRTRAPKITVPQGQQTFNFQLQPEQLNGPLSVEIEAEGFGINGDVETLLNIAP